MQQGLLLCEGLLPELRLHHRRPAAGGHASSVGARRGRGGSCRISSKGFPIPGPQNAARPFNILVAGIGGTGVITLGALLGMAAHLEGKGCLLLDVTGLAQKNGPVTSHVRIS